MRGICEEGSEGVEELVTELLVPYHRIGGCYDFIKTYLLMSKGCRHFFFFWVLSLRIEMQLFSSTCCRLKLSTMQLWGNNLRASASPPSAPPSKFGHILIFFIAPLFFSGDQSTQIITEKCLVLGIIRPLYLEISDKSSGSVTVSVSRKISGTGKLLGRIVGETSGRGKGEDRVRTGMLVAGAMTMAMMMTSMDLMTELISEADLMRRRAMSWQS